MRYDFDEVIDRKNTNSAKWDLVKELYEDKDVLPMWVADMDFKSPLPVIEALKKQVEHGIFGYVKRPHSCNEAIMDWVDKRHGWKIKKEWLTYSPGVVTALNICTLAMTQPGDKIIVQPPVYYPFFRVILNNGRQIVNNPLDFQNGRYAMDFDDLEKRAGSRTRLMIISSPHNPVGRVWTKEELTRLGNFCIKNDIILISDEVHSDLVFRGHQNIPTASISEEICEQTVTCIAPSKTFNLAGLKTSAIIISNPRIRQNYINMLQNLSIGMDNSFGLVAMETAYKHGREWLDQLLEYLEENLEFTITYFREKIPRIKPLRPEATYLIWLDCRDLGLDDEALNSFMIEKAKVWMDDGPMFGIGGQGFQRMNIACPRVTLEEGLKRIKLAVDSLES
jgi:cystathionine beta-lyase